jgi:hypothetical protein
VDALAVPLDLAVKNRVLVLGQHLLLRRHLRLPALDLLHAESEARKRTVERRDDAVDVPETLALAVLLVARQAPRDFPLRLLEMDPRSLFRGGFNAGPVVVRRGSGDGWWGWRTRADRRTAGLWSGRHRTWRRATGVMWMWMMRRRGCDTSICEKETPADYLGADPC